MEITNKKINELEKKVIEKYNKYILFYAKENKFDDVKRLNEGLEKVLDALNFNPVENFEKISQSVGDIDALEIFYNK